jgi:hypothetical protein
MENKKQNESLELSAQELEDIAGGMHDYAPGTDYSSTVDGYVQQINDKLSGGWGEDQGHYKKEEKYHKTETYENGSHS